MKWLALFPVTLATLAACSSSGGGGGSNVSIAQACADLATQSCNKVQSCSPTLVELSYGDLATCVAAQTGPCQSAVAAKGVTATAGDVEACAQAYSSTSCADLFADQQPSACQIHGTLAAGVACGSSIQCSGVSYCNIAAGSTCGVCAARAAAGTACASTSSCAPGLSCVRGAGGGNGTCVAPGAQGASCDAQHPCAGGLGCNNGTCGPALQAGAKCTPGSSQCDATQLLTCSAAGVCAAVAIAKAGQPCGSVAGGYTLCAGGATCNVGTGGTGTCGATVANGQACGTGGSCTPPAVCVNGQCALTDPSSCH